MATFLAKSSGVLAGSWVAQAVLHRVDPALQLEWRVQEGGTVERGQVVGVIRGSARSILIAERVALNFLQRMSGIATLTRDMVAAVAGTRAAVLDTRKTVPGLRLLDKWAVLGGGGRNHRMGLYDMVMIKDNHIAAAGSITQAVRATEVGRWGASTSVGDLAGGRGGVGVVAAALGERGAGCAQRVQQRWGRLGALVAVRRCTAWWQWALGS